MTFSTGDKAKIACVGVTNRLISIDCVLKCPRCTGTVPVWYLVESRNEIADSAVWVRVLKRTEKLPNDVLISYGKYGKYTEFLDKADRAFRDGLGAGAIVYLREIMEGVTYQVAQNEGIKLTGKNGGNFHLDRHWRKSMESVTLFRKSSQKKDIHYSAS